MLLLGGLLAIGGSLHAQGNFKVRGVHLVRNAANLDFYLNDRTPATIGDLPFEYTSALGSDIPAGPLNIKVAPTGLGIGGKIVEETTTGAGNFRYTAVAYGTLAQPKLKILARNRIQSPSSPTRTLIRFLDASGVPAAFDIYLDSTVGTPLFSAVMQDSVTAFKEIEGKAATFIVTPAGQKTVIARLEAPIPAGTIVTFIGTGTGPTDFKVYMLDEQDPNSEYRKLVLLQGREGLQPTLRIIHAVPVGDVRLVDVYLDNASTPKMTGLHYRSASPIFQTGTSSTTIRYTPFQLPPGQAFLTSDLILNSDTGYISVLTQFRSGATTAYTLTRYLQMPTTGGTEARVRVTNATDYFGDPGDPTVNLNFVITPQGGTPIQIPTLGFTMTTDWMMLPAGPVSIQAFRSGGTTPVFEGSATIDPSRDYTFIALGTDTSLTIDLVDHSQFGAQMPLRSFGQEESSVRTGAERVVARLAASPNPSTGLSRIEFMTTEPGQVTIELYDALGQRTLAVDRDWRQQGAHSVPVDASLLPSGRYHVVVRVDERIEAMGELVVVR